MSQKQQQMLGALCLAALCSVPAVASAQCGARGAGPDSALARPLTSQSAPGGDSLGERHRHAAATSRADPKLDAYRIAALDPRVRTAHLHVEKEQRGPLRVAKEDCGEIVDVPPAVGLTPFAYAVPEIPTPTIPPPMLLTASAPHPSLFGGLLIGAVAAGLLGHTGPGGTITGGTIGTGTPGAPIGTDSSRAPGGATPTDTTTTTTPGGGGTTPPGGGGGTTPPGGGGGATPPGGGGGTTPPGGGGGTTPPGGGGGTTPPGGGGGTTPPGGGGGTTPPGGGGGTTPSGGGGGIAPPGGTSVPQTPVPEPATVLLLAGGLAVLAASRRTVRR